LATGTTEEGHPLIDAALVRRLVDTQFPHWSGLGLTPVDPTGSDHVIFRLGDELSVRVPRHDGAGEQARKESVWLPRLAPHLPLAVPEPVAVGEPDLGCPWPWAVSRWLEGEAAAQTLADSRAAAVALAEFLAALQRCPGTADHGADGSLTTGSLADRDRVTREAIERTAHVFDASAMTALWEAALGAPAWDRPPVWFHGDLHPGNLLTVGGRITAVIDFGELGLGDPSRDMAIAFTLMSARARAVFRAVLGVDDATWARGRGWALTTGLAAYTAYAATDPRIAANTTWQITEALAG
jgi:aminoglycoside phosphotransferase (APT) family kinase protein